MKRSGKTRHPMMPTVPTTAEAGLPDFPLEAWVGLFAPTGTPPALVTQLSNGVKQALETPEAKKLAAGQGVEVRYMNPAALDTLVTTELGYWNKVIKKANITLD